MTTRILLRGAPRTGTHLLKQWLIDKHFPNLEILEANRHRLIDFADAPEEKLIVCAKHPMSWLVSMHRWVLHQNLGLENGGVYVDGILYETKKDFEAFVRTNDMLFRYWNHSYDNWLSFDKLVIPYELAITDPESIVLLVATTFDLPEPERIHPLPENNLSHKTPFDLEYYVEEKWRNEYNCSLWRECSQRFTA